MTFTCPSAVDGWFVFCKWKGCPNHTDSYLQYALRTEGDTAVFVSVTCELLTDILWSGLRLTGTNCDRWTEVAPCRKGTEDPRTQDIADSFLFKILFQKHAIAHITHFFDIIATIANGTSICHPPLHQI